MIPRKHAHLHTAAMTHAGAKGKNNEDRFCVVAFNTPEHIPVVFAMIADGVGGKSAGEVAAEMAVDQITHQIALSDARQPLATLENALKLASREIYRFGISQNAQKGMGTTACCTWVIGDKLYLANVGNSRAYLLRAGRLQQLSIDHSWVQEAMELGILTPEQASKHPNSNVITRYLGHEEEVKPDFRLRFFSNEEYSQSESNQGLTLQPGDIIFLCSDGLTAKVGDEDIGKQLSTHTLETALNSLVNLAIQREGSDNITVVALKSPLKTDRRPVLLKESKFIRYALVAGVILGLACLVVILIELLILM